MTIFKTEVLRELSEEVKNHFCLKEQEIEVLDLGERNGIKLNHTDSEVRNKALIESMKAVSGRLNLREEYFYGYELGFERRVDTVRRVTKGNIPDNLKVFNLKKNPVEPYSIDYRKNKLDTLRALSLKVEMFEHRIGSGLKVVDLGEGLGFKATTFSDEDLDNKLIGMMKEVVSELNLESDMFGNYKLMEFRYGSVEELEEIDSLSVPYNIRLYRRKYEIDISTIETLDNQARELANNLMYPRPDGSYLDTEDICVGQVDDPVLLKIALEKMALEVRSLDLKSEHSTSLHPTKPKGLLEMRRLDRERHKIQSSFRD